MPRSSPLLSRLCLAVAFAAPLAIYATSLYPGIRMWDTAEAQTVPYLLGIAHRTGSPLYILSGWMFSHLFVVGNVAWRLSLFSALAMSVTAACLYVAGRLLDLPPLVALAATAVFVCTDVVWTRATRAEIHSLAALWVAVGYVAALRWSRTGATRDAYVLALSIGCGLITHPLELMTIPGLAIVTVRRWRTVTPGIAGRMAVLIFAPLAVYAYIPLRSAYIVAHGLEPDSVLGLAGQPIWNYDNPSTPARFFTYLASMGGPVGVGLIGMLSPDRWTRVASAYGRTLLDNFGAFSLAFAAIGFVTGLRERPLETSGLVISAILPVAFVLNFEESDPPRYFLASYWVVALLVGYGSYRLICGYLNSRPGASVLAALVLATLGGWEFHSNLHLFEQRTDRSGEDFIANIQRLTPDDAIVVATWLMAPTLGYAGNVDRNLGHRLVVTAAPDQYAQYYAGWLRSRPIFVRSEVPFALPREHALRVTLVDRVNQLYRITDRRSAASSSRTARTQH